MRQKNKLNVILGGMTTSQHQLNHTENYNVVNSNLFHARNVTA